MKSKKMKKQAFSFFLRPVTKILKIRPENTKIKI